MAQKIKSPVRSVNSFCFDQVIEVIVSQTVATPALRYFVFKILVQSWVTVQDR